VISFTIHKKLICNLEEKMIKRLNRLYLYGVFSIFITACSSDKTEPVLPADILYKQAIEAYKKEDYELASENFKLLEKEYPFSKFTKDGLLKTAFAQYETAEYEDAATTIKRYMDLYPGASDTDYALYLLAMSYYNQITDPRRDHEISLTAQKYLNELLSRYPNSEHSVDGRIKLDFVNNQIAAKEMIIGRFYLNEHQYPAAINRFKYVIKNHETTIHVKEALYRLVESYLILGLNKPAYQTAALLGYNYPESKWYHLAYDLITKDNPDYIETKPVSKEQATSWWEEIIN
jgi:outer membrane protein assembly factor BamD